MMRTSPNGSPKPLTLSITNYSYALQNRLTNDDDDFDGVKVEISELDNSCPNPTTVSLMDCRKKIILPFHKLLCLIGWRPFGADSLRRSSTLLRIFNIVYPLLVLLLLLFNYAYEIFVCEWKLNVGIDTKTTTTTPAPIENQTITNWSSLVPGKHIHRRNTTTMGSHVCGHVITTYILPDILHFAAFAIGFLYFRVTEGEPLYSLMEKVFLRADHNMRQLSSTRVIRQLRIFMFIGCIWVLASASTYALSNVINHFSHPLVSTTSRQVRRYSFFIIDIICLLVSNCIHFAIVLNFVAHCELVIFYCKSIRTRLEEKSLPLAEAMKQILDLGSSISQLNGTVSRTISILIVFFLERTILGFILLMLNEIELPLVYAYRTLYPIVWCSILLFCLAQAARVTSKCDKLDRIGLSMRVYGYHNASPDELDGFLLFLSQAELRAKLFGLTMRPGKIIFIIVTIMTICVVLLQTNIIPHSTSFLP